MLITPTMTPALSDVVGTVISPAGDGYHPNGWGWLVQPTGNVGQIVAVPGTGELWGLVKAG